MRIEISQFEFIEDSVLATVIGQWRWDELLELVAQIQSMKPRYLVFDPTDTMLAPDVALNVEDSSLKRQKLLTLLAEMMQSEKGMLFIVINKNDNPVFETSKQFFIHKGVGKQFFLVSNSEEALAIIEDCEESG